LFVTGEDYRDSRFVYWRNHLCSLGVRCVLISWDPRLLKGNSGTPNCGRSGGVWGSQVCSGRTSTKLSTPTRNRRWYHCRGCLWFALKDCFVLCLSKSSRTFDTARFHYTSIVPQPSTLTPEHTMPSSQKTSIKRIDNTQDIN